VGFECVAEPIFIERESSWKKVIDSSIPAIVAIHVINPRPFDSERPGVSQATGFVVDAKLGLILTNRLTLMNGLDLNLQPRGV
jgi:hypothetical protein